MPLSAAEAAERLALRIATEVDAVIDALVIVCQNYVVASERETVCGSFIFTVRSLTQKMRDLAPTVWTNEDNARFFGELVLLVTTETRALAAMLQESGWTGRFAVLLDRAAPGLVEDLESFSNAVQQTREAGAAAADLIAEAMATLKRSEAKLAATMAAVVVVVIAGVVFYFAGPPRRR